MSKKKPQFKILPSAYAPQAGENFYDHDHEIKRKILNCCAIGMWQQGDVVGYVFLVECEPIEGGLYASWWIHEAQNMDNHGCRWEL